jgi:hypothetical protein
MGYDLSETLSKGAICKITACTLHVDFDRAAVFGIHSEIGTLRSARNFRDIGAGILCARLSTNRGGHSFLVHRLENAQVFKIVEGHAS